MIRNFEQQYNRAKETFLKAIRDKNNIVLYGEGANGKSYLCRDLISLIQDDYYIIYPTHEKHHELFKYVESLDKKFICHINDMSIIDSGLKYQDYIFINMNTFQYPAFSTLRSGKKL
jgi:hypothetical protein